MRLLDVAPFYIGIDNDRRGARGLDAGCLDLRSLRALVGMLLRADLRERAFADPAMCRRMTRGCQRVVGEKQCRAGVGDGFRETTNGLDPLGMLRHVPNVNRENPVRMLAHEALVDLRILLTAVADEDERQCGICRENLTDLRALVLAGAHQIARNVPVAKEHWPDRNLLRVEEVGDDVVEIPRAARDVEDRIRFVAASAALESAVERRDPREG